MVELVENKIGLEVLTDTGWSHFDGVLDKGVREIACLQLTSVFINATLDHEVFSSNLIKKTIKQLKPGDVVYTKLGPQSVVSVTLLGQKHVYDLLNVQNNRRFYANDVLCSNCEFIINDETLIAPAKLLDLKATDILYKTGQVRWYAPIRAGNIYVVSLDPSLGTGGDPAAIQIFEANSTQQVGEWRHNRTPIPEQVRILSDICRHINETVKDEKSIYYSVENNTIGEAALISIAEWGEENIQGYFLSDTNNSGGNRRLRKGFNTTPKTKLAACSKLKNLIETGRMRISSASLISELKTFVASGVSYAAKPGETDDLVMSAVLAVRMLQVLQTFYTDLDTQMKDHGDAVIEPMPFISVMH